MSINFTTEAQRTQRKEAEQFSLRGLCASVVNSSSPLYLVGLRRNLARFFFLPLALFLLLIVFTLPTPAAMLTISDQRHHLGVPGQPEWNVFDGTTPEGQELKLTFQARRNAREFTLFLRQDDVKQDWPLFLNGKRIGQLFTMEAPLVHTLAIPPDALRDGANELVIRTKTPEDIVISGVWFGDSSKEDLLAAGPVTFTVFDEETSRPTPARITITDARGFLAPIYDYGSTNLATRPGVVYTATGEARLKLLPGAYTIYATRGPEYSVARVENFDPSRTSSLDLKIRRLADTRGWIASDTHIHTVTVSKHGDAQLWERVITLAGEAIEMPVATEHNLHEDYRKEAAAQEMLQHFTPVPGNEVTTRKGHFNIFPVDLTAPPPDASLENWPELFREIRRTPHVQTVTLNHPLDSHSRFTPLAITNIHVLTGKNLRGDFEFEFDAMELINSGAMRSQWMEVFRAWFALLNRGHKITGVGSSDSHDVSRFIVGQGRTYIRGDDSDPSNIDVRQACENLNRGHAIVSLGLFARMTISEPGSTRQAGPGNLITAESEELELNITIDAPLAPGKSPFLTLCANGWPIAEFFAACDPDRPFRTTVQRIIPKPRHDTHYVLIAEIYDDPAPYWGLARPYQPTSRRFRPTLIGAINPIWIDADGDGKFTSSRGYARALVSEYENSPQKLLSELGNFDRPVTWHAAELLGVTLDDVRSGAWARLLERPSPVRQGFHEYVEAQYGVKP